MRRALAFACLFATLAGCAATPSRPLAVHGETVEARESSEYCYQLIVCPLVSASLDVE